MTPPAPTRRRLVQWAMAAPLLPFEGVAQAADALGRHHSMTELLRRATAVRFVGMDAPTLAEPQAMAATTVRSFLEVTVPHQPPHRLALAHHALFTTGDLVPDGRGATVVAGGCHDIHGAPILDRSVPGQTRPFFSDCPDGSSLIVLPGAKPAGVKGRAVFAVVQFEYVTRHRAGDQASTKAEQQAASMYGRLPSPIAVLTLDQDPVSGHLRLVKYHNVDTAPAHGLWITCGASLSPWNTHLSSEEYEPDTASIASNAVFQDFSRNLFGDATKANPYHYGHLPEVTVNPDGTGSVKKHYCLGRISHELVQVMPDQRTVLMGDDATNGGLFMFIADRATDLSSGKLYVAKWHQTSGTGPGSAKLSWMLLGAGSSAQIEALADSLTLADIMEVRTTDPGDKSFTRIPFGGKPNWVRLQPGMEWAAAFLETHRYAALVGASLGFTKMEGTTVNVRDKKAYSAMSYIQTSMLDGSGHIRVEGPRAGAVYELNLRGGQVDQRQQAIDSDWVPVDMAAVPELIGADLPQPDALGNLADANRIANPDNIKFSEKLRTLFIGEDSGMHVNNFLWAYQVDTRQLTRLLSCPAGAESTGLHAVDEVHGWTYLFSNFQHAGDWESPLHDKVKATLDPLVRARFDNRYGATVGYLTAEMPRQRRRAI